jgi:fermentation-respiration switch protein FrsA (DUF1100 family)
MSEGQKMSDDAVPATTKAAQNGSTMTVSSATRRLISLALRAYLVVLAPLALFQRSLIYHPHPCSRLLARDAALSQTVVDLTVKSEDGLDLHGWLALAGTTPISPLVDPLAVLEEGGPVVLFFPGNAGDRSMRTLPIAMLNSLNAHVAIFDYRGYADNAGKPSEKNLARDARAVWNHLTADLGIAPHRIVIYGESLGGGVATRLASDLCQSGTEPGGLIVQSTFNSLVAAAQAHFSVVPVSLILVDRFPSSDRIPNVTCPILQIHGEQDSIVSFRLGQLLFDAAPAKSSRGISKQQIALPRANHNDVYLSSADERQRLVAGLSGFLDHVNRAPEPSSVSADPVPQVRFAPSVVAGWPVLIDGTFVVFTVIVIIGGVLWWFDRRRAKRRETME